MTKKKKTQTIKSEMKVGIITTKLAEIVAIIREYYEKNVCQQTR